MESLVRSEFDRIGRDRRSGAAELALRAARVLRRRLARPPEAGSAELTEIARALLALQPEMAPLLRLANEVAAAAGAPRAHPRLARALAQFEHRMRAAPAVIARRFRHAIPPGAVVLTYSYSSTVLQALSGARGKIAQVYCSESRPGNEGRVAAARLARARVRVTLLTDAALFSLPPIESHIVLGADRVTRRGFVNKIGSSLLAKRARRARRPPAVWILSDTSKFLPDRLEHLAAARPGPPGEIWRDPPRGVRIENASFELTPFARGMRILTERGWLGPRQAARALENIRVAPLLGRAAILLSHSRRRAD